MRLREISSGMPMGDTNWDMLCITGKTFSGLSKESWKTSYGTTELPRNKQYFREKTTGVTHHLISTYQGNLLTVTKIWQKMGHIVRRSLHNLTKCCTINTKFIYLVKLRRMRHAMCPIFCHILATVTVRAQNIWTSNCRRNFQYITVNLTLIFLQLCPREMCLG